MSQPITVGEDQGYVPHFDEKPNNNQYPVNIPQRSQNDNIEMQYPVDIKQGEGISNSLEDDQALKAQIRKGFIRKVFGIVSFQLIFTFLFVLICQTPLFKHFISKYQVLWTFLVSLSIVCFLVSSCVLVCNRKISRKVPHNYIILFLITLSESFICATMSLQFSYEIVIASLLLTIAASLGIILYTYFTKSDLSGCRMGIIVLVSQLFFFACLNFFLRSSFLNLLFCFAGTALAGMYLVYDVQLIYGKFGIEYNIEDYIFAAMQLYIDIIRLFLEILRIVGKFQKK
jgi:FtsH-binding integral membrane protein